MRPLLLRCTPLAAATVILSASGLVAPASAQQAGLAGVPCGRLAAALVSYHEGSLELEAMAIGFGGKASPDVAAFGERLKPIVAYMKARKLEPRRATEAEPLLYRSSGSDMLKEFEQRCASPGAKARPRG